MRGGHDIRRAQNYARRFGPHWPGLVGSGPPRDVRLGWRAAGPLSSLRIELATARLGPLMQPPSASPCVYKREEVPRSDYRGITYALIRIVATPVPASSGL